MRFSSIFSTFSSLLFTCGASAPLLPTPAFADTDITQQISQPKSKYAVVDTLGVDVSVSVSKSVVGS